MFNRPLERGGAIHNVLRSCFVHLRTAGEFPDDLAARAAGYLPRIGYPDRETWQEDVTWIAKLAADYLATIAAPQARERLVALKWACTYERADDPAFLLTVRADRVVRLDDGRYRIIEYKSGKPDYPYSLLTSARGFQRMRARCHSRFTPGFLLMLWRKEGRRFLIAPPSCPAHCPNGRSRVGTWLAR